MSETYLYYCLMREPEKSRLPNGCAAFEAWESPRRIPGFEAQVAMGWVEYPRPLSFDHVHRFDLHPADPVELARYRFWVAANMHDGEAKELEIAYTSADPSTLRTRLKRADHLAHHAQVLIRDTELQTLYKVLQSGQ
jgi:hypothetical protein